MNHTQRARAYQRPSSFIGGFLLILSLAVTNYALGDAGCCVMSAGSTGVKIKTKLISKTIGSASIGCNGGNKSTSNGAVNIPGLVTVASTSNSATGSAGQTASNSSVGSFTLVAGANTISFVSANSNASAKCGASVGTTGNSKLQALIVNGTPVTITGAINQVIPIIGGKITVNRQSTKGTGCVRNISVSALAVSVPDVIDASFGNSQAGVACIEYTCSQ